MCVSESPKVPGRKLCESHAQIITLRKKIIFNLSQIHSTFCCFVFRRCIVLEFSHKKAVNAKSFTTKYSHPLFPSPPESQICPTILAPVTFPLQWEFIHRLVTRALPSGIIQKDHCQPGGMFFLWFACGWIVAFYSRATWQVKGISVVCVTLLHRV